MKALAKSVAPGQKLLALVLILLSIAVWGPAALAAGAAADGQLTPMDAEQLKSQLTKDGQATVVNLWASWCEPCKKEMPALLDFMKKQKDAKLVLISGDTPDEQAAAVAVLAKFQIDFPTYLVKGDPEVFMKAFVPGWPGVVPTTMLFDKKGQRTAYWLGELKTENLENSLETLRGKTKAPAKKKH